MVTVGGASVAFSSPLSMVTAPVVVPLSTLKLPPVLVTLTVPVTAVPFRATLLPLPVTSTLALTVDLV